MTPVERGIESLRRYVDSAKEKCPGPHGYHNADVLLGEVPYPNDSFMGWGRDDEPHDDPRWPLKCDGCPYVFKPEYHWQHNMCRLYQGAPDGKLYTNRDMPPGAMYDATWYSEKGPDGIALMVILPPEGGDDAWFVDDTRWHRTGTIPNITATPSILTPRYHGFLRNGVLEEC